MKTQQSCKGQIFLTLLQIIFACSRMKTPSLQHCCVPTGLHKVANRNFASLAAATKWQTQKIASFVATQSRLFRIALHDSCTCNRGKLSACTCNEVANQNSVSGVAPDKVANQDFGFRRSKFHLQHCCEKFSFATLMRFRGKLKTNIQSYEM